MEPARYYRGAEKKKTKQTNKSFIFIYFFQKASAFPLTLIAPSQTLNACGLFGSRTLTPSASTLFHRVGLARTLSLLSLSKETDRQTSRCLCVRYDGYP